MNEAARASHASLHSGALAHGAEGQETSVAGQNRWLSATPLVGSDDRVGAWVIVITKAPSGSAAEDIF